MDTVWNVCPIFFRIPNGALLRTPLSACKLKVNSRLSSFPRQYPEQMSLRWGILICSACVCIMYMCLCVFGRVYVFVWQCEKWKIWQTMLHAICWWAPSKCCKTQIPNTQIRERNVHLYLRKPPLFSRSLFLFQSFLPFTSSTLPIQMNSRVIEYHHFCTSVDCDWCKLGVKLMASLEDDLGP